MSKAKKVLAIALTALMLVTAMSFTALAARKPSATVTPLSGADLSVTLADMSQPASLVGKTYTMASGVQFTANDTDPGKFADYICDFEITLNSPTGSVDGSKFILVGNYGAYGNVGRKLTGTVPNGTYPVLVSLGLDSKLTYAEVLSEVGAFTCGIVDLGLPAGTTVDVQLTMYPNEGGVRGTAIPVGDPVVYKNFPKISVKELTGTELNVTVDGKQYAMASGVKFTANAPSAAYADYICDFEITLDSPTGTVDGDQFILVGNYGAYGDVGKTFTGTVSNGTYPVLASVGLDSKLTYDEVYNDVRSFKCGVVDLGLPAGTTATVQFVIYPNEGGVRGTAIPVGDPVEYKRTESTSIKITDKDAFIDDGGMGYLRFITAVNYEQGSTVEYYGTWFIPQLLLANATDNDKAKVQYDNSIESGQSFSADLFGIPNSALDLAIAAVSYMKVDGQELATDVVTASVEAVKNVTSN